MKKVLGLIKGKLTFFAAIVLAAFIGGAMTTVVKASIPDGDGVIHGCYSTSRGSLYIIDSASQSCASGETSLTWDQHGTPAGSGYGDLVPSSFANASVSQTDFSFRNMSGGNFTNTDFTGANLSHANFTDANLSGSHLSVSADRVNFTNVNFSGADFSSANITASNFTDADLSDLSLAGRVLNGSNFSHTDLSNVDFSDAGLAGVTGLDTATLSGVTWSNTNCPDETNSNDHGNTCAGHLTP